MLGACLDAELCVLAERSVASQSSSVPQSSYLIERSHGFIANTRGSRDTARQSLRLLGSCFGTPIPITPNRALAAGFTLRPLLPGRKRGQLWLVPAVAVVAAREVLADVPTSRRLPSIAVADEPRDAGELIAAGYTRVDGRIRDRSRGSKARCPLHDDHDPSLSLMPCRSGHEHDGPGRCHGCGKSVHWRRSTDGTRWVRAALGSDLGRMPVSDAIVGARCSRPIRSGTGLGVPRSVVPVSSVDGLLGRTLAGRDVRLALHADVGRVRASRSGVFRRSWSSQSDPIRAAVSAETTRSGPAARASAWRAWNDGETRRGDPIVGCPDALLSVAPLRASVVSVCPMRDRPFAVLRVDDYAADVQTRWALVDIDDLTPAIAWDRAAFARRCARIAGGDERLSGRMQATETSTGGVQAWFETRDPIVLGDPALGAWYASLAGRVLAAARTCSRAGGHVDPSSWAPHRYGRLPGWRVCEDDEPFCARLLGAVDDPTRGVESASELRRRWRAGKTSTGGGAC